MRCSLRSGVSIDAELKQIMEEHLLTTEQLIPALALTTLGLALVYAIVNFFRTSKQQGERQETPLTQASERKRADKGSIIRR